MATEKANESYLELYDVAKKETVARAPLSKIRFIPRTGEHIFIPLGPSDWDSYTVVSVEYFLGYEESIDEASRTDLSGTRITLYVEGRSKT